MATSLFTYLLKNSENFIDTIAFGINTKLIICKIPISVKFGKTYGMITGKKIEQVIEDSAIATRDEARTIKVDLKREIIRTEKLVESVERRVKSIQDETRVMIDKENDRNDKLRERIQNRMDSLDDSLTNKLKQIEKDTDERIKKALNNPLSKM